MAPAPDDSGQQATASMRGAPVWLGLQSDVVTGEKETDAVALTSWSQDHYGASGEATGEELALIRILGVALILLLIIVGMALSQYIICFLACSGHPSPL